MMKDKKASSVEGKKNWCDSINTDNKFLAKNVPMKLAIELNQPWLVIKYQLTDSKKLLLVVYEMLEKCFYDSAQALSWPKLRSDFFYWSLDVILWFLQTYGNIL